MRVTGIDVAYIHSAHAKALAEWFSETLGLEPGYTDGHWFAFEPDAGSPFAIDATGFPRSVVEAQPVVLSWRVDDIHDAVAELTKRGVRFHPSPEETVFDVGPKLVATFQDPDGNWHQLSQPKPH